MRLGNLAVFLLLFEAVTGLGLMFYYRPTVAAAYADMIDLQEVSFFGFARGLHRWGAYAAVIVVWLHLLQTALRGAYAPPRRFNWIVGVVLMILTLLLALTGYLLTWDQQAYWGIVLLSPTDNQSMPASLLLFFYVAHCAVLPLLMAVVTAYHLRRTRLDDAEIRRQLPAKDFEV